MTARLFFGSRRSRRLIDEVLIQQAAPLGKEFKSEVDREWTLQQHQLDPDDNTESKRPSFRPAVVPYQTLMSLCNELHRPNEGSSRFGKRFCQGKRH